MPANWGGLWLLFRGESELLIHSAVNQGSNVNHPPKAAVNCSNGEDRERNGCNDHAARNTEENPEYHRLKISTKWHG
jgi:hypothetical protein